MVSSDNANICSACDTKAEFLHKDATCYSTCPQGYYNDAFLKQCRPCDGTCFSCSGKLFNNCLSCTNLLYLVQSLNICVDNCEQYGLTKSVSISNVCVPFTAKAEILNYDLNVRINPRKFTTIVGRVFNATSISYETQWRLDNTETQNINPGLILPDTPPWNSSDTNLTVSLNPDWFLDGFNYVIYLDIKSKNSGQEVVIPIKFTFLMNLYPTGKNSNINLSIYKYNNLLIKFYRWWSWYLSF